MNELKLMINFASSDEKKAFRSIKFILSDRSEKSNGHMINNKHNYICSYTLFAIGESIFPTLISTFCNRSAQQSALLTTISFPTFFSSPRSTLHHAPRSLPVCVQDRSQYRALVFPSTALEELPFEYVDDCFVGLPLARFSMKMT